MAVTTPEDAGIYTFDQLLRQRAVDPDQTPLVAYPRTPQGVDDYELVPGATLDRFVDGAAKALLEAGLEPVVRTVLFTTQNYLSSGEGKLN
jgi:hypothetical protein